MYPLNEEKVWGGSMVSDAEGADRGVRFYVAWKLQEKSREEEPKVIQ